VIFKSNLQMDNKFSRPVEEVVKNIRVALAE